MRVLAFLFVVLMTAFACGPSRDELLAQSPKILASQISFPAGQSLEGATRPRAHRPTIVAFSGGGPDGAFGAGLAVGRRDAGQPFREDIVTGVSIGALIATLVFAGEEERLESLFTKGGLEPLGTVGNPLRAIALGSLSSGDQYAALLDEAVPLETIARVAQAHHAGRRLLIGTTDLETMNMIVWDMGAIAASSDADAPTLFRQILRASASVPAVYPPVSFVKDGALSSHVDGGVTAQFYLPRGSGAMQASGVTIIVNNSLYSDEPLESYTAISTAQRAFSTLIRGQTRDQIRAERLAATNNGTAFSVYSLPEGWPAARLQDFSPSAMARTFALGRDIGQKTAN